tara:strand:- start:154 stop:582 length:429 start_codon:yes stop_codon:yes gene_type:complete
MTHEFKGLKVLVHDVYQKRKHRDERLLDELNNYQEEIDPVFHRDGEYLLGDKCWFEVRGRAFKKRKQDFLFELRQCEMADIDINVVNKLVEIKRISSGFLTCDQCNLITEYSHFIRNRDNKRLSRKRIKEMRIRISQYRKDK